MRIVICLRLPRHFGYVKLFFQLLNVYRVSDVRHVGIHTAESSILEPSLFEVEIAIANLKRYKSSGNEQIPAELL
jgi:hypothetical protein